MTRLSTTVLGCGCGCAALVAMVLLVCLALEGPPSREFYLAYPLEKAETHGRDELFVHVASGVSLSEVCELTLFDGFSPAMTLSHADEKHGKPDSHSKERDGLDDVFSYQTGRAMIDIVQQTVFDSDGGEVEEKKRFLRARPIDRLPETHLISAVIAAIPHALYSSTVSVHLIAEDGEATYVLEQGEIEAVWLYPPPILGEKTGEIDLDGQLVNQPGLPDNAPNR